MGSLYAGYSSGDTADRLYIPLKFAGVCGYKLSMHVLGARYPIVTYIPHVNLSADARLRDSKYKYNTWHSH